MDKKAIEAYLDDPTRPPQHADDRELVNLLEEISELDVPDPGPDYWNQFNHRLQNRLAEEQTRRQTAWWHKWLRAPIWMSGAVALILLVAFLTLRPQQAYDSPSLASMNQVDLQFLVQLYDDATLGDLTSQDAFTDEWDLELIDEFGTESEAIDLYFEPDSFDGEELKSMWDQKG
ncbi:hypothetical protein SCOR_10575 [Sulfidibacter corallicola]|uniref:Uncharacterized protein n=1 Tax=Sulfidibacter corallicola TaxID=2818388 RepID=A0A8A4THD6_SULCO|nr:hypothetical protein [Sulfidibacter corallicola]QTD48221.1 hypothetical protein J3U87_21765 [Sulfidibacter corallicola]